MTVHSPGQLSFVCVTVCISYQTPAPPETLGGTTRGSRNRNRKGKSASQAEETAHAKVSRLECLVSVQRTNWMATI